MRKPKTKISGIVDNSSMGISIQSDSEMEISKKVEKKLRKGMQKSIFFTLISGSAMSGNSQWLLKIDDYSILYEFKIGKNGGSTFLNVTGNPTKLMCGTNDIPVLLRDKEYSNNSALNTFMYANRILYAILEFIPDMEFDWGADKSKILRGDINLTRFQLAWYSGDLKDKRNDVLTFLRVCYGGVDATQGLCEHIGANIKINTRMWNNNNNLTLEKYSGNNKKFSLTLYAKDNEPDYDGEDKHRLVSLIRFDCTFMASFLNSKNMKTVKDLETVYEEKCSEDGYDIGFVRWLANEVQKDLYLDYVVDLNSSVYFEDKLKLMEGCISNKKALSESKLAAHWFSYKEPLEGKVIESVGINPDKFKSYADRLFKKTGIDIRISRSFHEALLFNRRNSHLSREERADLMSSKSNNRKIDIIASIESRDEDNLTLMTELIFNKSVRIKKMIPRSLKYSEFWAFKRMQEIYHTRDQSDES